MLQSSRIDLALFAITCCTTQFVIHMTWVVCNGKMVIQHFVHWHNVLSTHLPIYLMASHHILPVVDSTFSMSVTMHALHSMEFNSLMILFHQFRPYRAFSFQNDNSHLIPQHDKEEDEEVDMDTSTCVLSNKQMMLECLKCVKLLTSTLEQHHHTWWSGTRQTYWLLILPPYKPDRRDRYYKLESFLLSFPSIDLTCWLLQTREGLLVGTKV